jgi:hypothetical protein
MTRKSLLDAFAPPAGLQGQVALLVSMSATRSFLEAAVRRFTGLGRERRASMGIPLAYLALDAHATEGRDVILSPLAIPGLIELAPVEAARTRLLHAKLGLLGFGRARLGEVEVLRLVITTGNWTDASARSQLELLWYVDVPCRGREEVSAADPEDRADMAAAARFARRLLERYDAPAPSQRGPQACGRLHALLDRCEGVAPRGVPPRFIHSLEQPLIDPIRARLRGRRGLNVLLCGSGSFEQPRAPKKGQRARTPEALRVLKACVPGANWDSQTVTVEPAAAGALAAWAPYAEDDGWALVAPEDPLRKRARRTLHAKFIFIGHAAGGQVHRGLLYLGSGNLTRRGLLLAGPAGNIECGVLLDMRGPRKWGELREALFSSTNTVAHEDLVGAVRADDEPSEVAALVQTPPLRAACLREDATGAYLELHWRDGAKGRFTLDLGGAAQEEVIAGAELVRLPPGVVPAAVRFRSGPRSPEWCVAVETDSNRVGAVSPRAEDFDDALTRILDFPAPLDASDADEDESELGEPDREGPKDTGTSGEGAGPSRVAVEIAEYPLQKAMLFLDRVGTHQSGLEPYLVDDWLHHLEGAIQGNFRPEDVQGWRGVAIPFRSALLAPGFRPPEMTSEQKGRYRDIVRRFVTAVEGA